LRRALAADAVDSGGVSIDMLGRLSMRDGPLPPRCCAALRPVVVDAAAAAARFGLVFQRCR